MPKLGRSYNLVWLRAFYRLRSWTSAKPRLLKLGAATVVGAVLLAPSLWMLRVIPPLWRDLDAYIQVTQPPGTATILLWGPLYCLIARIPLYLGYALDCLNAGAPFPRLGFFLRPTLTDSGVFMLLVSQHVALWCSAFYLIVLTSRLFLVRLMLAVAWAANPLFYAFAHCVGSETLSMVLVLLLGAIGLRIIQHRRTVFRKEWILFGVLLWLCILTRHINAVLAAVMPLTFLFLSAYQSITIPFARSQLLGRWRRLRARSDLQKATVAVAVGISCIILANASLRGLCNAAHIPYHSTVGFTFLFRLKFLGALPAEKRNQLLDKVAKSTASSDVKKAISLLRNAPPHTPGWSIKAFSSKQAQASLSERETDLQAAKLCLLLNRMAQAFLCPPEKILLSAVASDFKKSQESTIPSVVNQLFASTMFYFLHPEITPHYASLYTFRDKSSTQIVAIFEKHSYFHRRKSFSYSAFLFFWFINLALLAVLAKVRKEEVAAVSSYAAALTLVGLIMMIVNCFLNEFQARYTLPMWELSIMSATLLFGKTIELCFPRRRIA